MARHRNAVWRLARSATGGSDEALDITQETFVAAFGALRRYDPQRPFHAWLARITLNKCRDWARRRAVRRLFTFAMPEGLDAAVHDDAPLADRQAGDRAELASVERAISALPTQLKDVLLLRTVEGLSQAETAIALGITGKAVETRLHRARAKISEVVRGSSAPRV